MLGRINKYSFFLWLTKKEKFEIKDDVVTFKNENNEDLHKSALEKTHPIEILLLKLLPAWVLFGFMLHVLDFKHILLGVFFLVLIVLVVVFIPKYFKKFMILLSIMGLYFIIPGNGLEVPFEQMVYVISMFMLFYYLAKETYSLFYEDQYYYLEDVVVKIDVKGTQARPGKKKLFKKIPFFGLTNKQKRVHLGKMSFNGYYLRIKKEQKEDIND